MTTAPRLQSTKIYSVNPSQGPEVWIENLKTTVSKAESNSGPTRIKLIISDSHQIGCELLRTALSRFNRFEVVGAAVNSRDLREAAAETNPDVALISCDLDDGPFIGFKALSQLHQTSPRTRNIIMTEKTNRELVVDAFRSGAKGVFHRSGSFQALCRCIQAVHKGQIWASSNEIQYVIDALATTVPLRAVNTKGEDILTYRERQVVALVAEGLTNREISQTLKLSEHTVKNHLFRIFEKLGISSRVELILYVVTPRDNAT